MKGAKRLHLPLCGLGMLSPPSPAPILPIPVVFLSRALSQAQSIPSSIFFWLALTGALVAAHQPSLQWM